MKPNCSTCRYLIELKKHPLNDDFGKGSILESCGWVCLNPELTNGKIGYYFETNDGLCECHKTI